MTKAEQKMKSGATKCRVAANIHCECVMVAYLYQYAAFKNFLISVSPNFVARLAITG